VDSDDEFLIRKRSERDFGKIGFDIMASYRCLNNTAATNYMNNPRVQSALHVKQGLPKWMVCNHHNVFDVYNFTESVRDTYLRILSAKKVRILLYNGDLDSLCSFLGDEWFVDSLNQKVVKPFSFWYTEGPYGSQQVAGSVKHYENITFATVRGAGHSTPVEKPFQSFVLFSRFMDNTF